MIFSISNWFKRRFTLNTYEFNTTISTYTYLYTKFSTMLIYGLIWSTCDLYHYILILTLTSKNNTDLFILQSNKIIEYCYLSNWYELSLKSQKSITLLMERAKRPLTIEIYNLVFISLESLGVVSIIIIVTTYDIPILFPDHSVVLLIICINKSQIQLI